MPKIQVLDSHVADLIAAGEVVERPASVAKELMENAIDAGASVITVEINHGGMTFLRVTDNGRGIPTAEIKTAFLRHATSKLRTEYDLEAIGTLGFRGEALAAISAVSRMQILSRTPDAPLGASLSLEGGMPGQTEDAGCPLGTTMVVRDLFYNTPARLKFLKKDAAEGAAVFLVVQRVALSHPEVIVKFIRDGKQELLTPGDGQLQSAIYAVLGRELTLSLRRVMCSGEDMTVSGFVSLPACCRASRNWQFFFVNGRQVKSPLMMAALEEAYKNQKMVGKFPGCVIHLNLKLNAVDVNVHPTKTEVKFGNERQVFSAVYHAVLSALEGDRSHPIIELQATIPSPSLQSSLMGNGASTGAGSLDSRPNTQGTICADEVTSNQTRLSIPVRSPTVRVQDTAFRPGVSPFLKQSLAPTLPKTPQIAKPLSPSAAQRPPAGFAKHEPASPSGGKPILAQEVASDSAPFSEEISWRMAGEVLNTYIIVERGETVFFIDKHAAHERINFDRMKAEGYDPMAQTLLAPIICRLPTQEQEALLSHLPLLAEFGFDLDELGDSLAVRQSPFDVEVGNIESTLSEIAVKLLSTGGADPAAARDELLHTMACKAAIKGGWKSSPQELERVARAVMAGEVKYCPHGRPVAIELSKKELEKQFKRA